MRRMIETEPGDDAYFRNQYVRRVEAASKTHLEYGCVDACLTEVDKSHRRDELEKRGMMFKRSCIEQRLCCFF